MPNQSTLWPDSETLLNALDHSIRSPLNAIYHHTELLLMGLDGDLSETVKADLQIVADEAHKLNEVLAQLLRWLPFQMPEIVQLPINIARLMQQVVRELSIDLEHNVSQRLDEVVEQNVQVVANEEMLQQVFKVLLSYFMGQREYPDATVLFQVNGGSVEIGFSASIPADANGSLSKLDGSTSVDLLMSTILVERMQGQWIMNSSESGNSLKLIFPRRTD